MTSVEQAKGEGLGSSSFFLNAPLDFLLGQNGEENISMWQMMVVTVLGKLAYYQTIIQVFPLS